MTSPKNWTPESEVDPQTGASIKSRSRTAELLQISERQLDRLVLAGKLPVRTDGLFEVRETIDAYAVYLADKASKPNRQDGLRDKKTEVLRRQIAREDQNVIEMPDALETIDLTTGAFLHAIDMVAQELGEVDDPEKAAWVIADVRATLAEKFLTHRLELETGKRASL